MNPQANPSTSQSYVLRVYNDFGCDDFDTVRVIVNKPTVIVVPNLISPNGDGANDIFRVRGNVTGSFLFAVYDQWGKVLFSTEDPSNGWDGQSDGVEVESGTYAYMVQAETLSGSISKSGLVTLIR